MKRIHMPRRERGGHRGGQRGPCDQARRTSRGDAWMPCVVRGSLPYDEENRRPGHLSRILI